MSRSISRDTLHSRDFRLWLRRWWAEDFSIEGLAKRNLTPPPQFRTREVNFAGRRWYGAYCPPIDLDGNYCTEFEELDWPKFHHVFRPDSSSGVYVLIVPGAFLGDVNVVNASIKSRIVMDHAFVGGPLRIGDASRATVSLEANAAYFTDRLDIRAIAVPLLSLKKAILKGEVHVAGVRQAKLGAAGATFAAPVFLGGEILDMDLSGAHVRAPLSFVDIARLDKMTATRARFHQALTISAGTINNGVHLSGARFNKGLEVSSDIRGKLDLSSARVKGAARILKADHLTSLSINAAHVTGDLTLERCSGEVDGNGLSVGQAYFKNCTLQNLKLRDATANGVMEIDVCDLHGQLVLEKARVTGRFVFRESTVKYGIWAKEFECSSRVNLRGSKFGDTNSFRRAKFKGGLDLNSRSDRIENRRDPIDEVGSVDFREAEFGVLDHLISLDFSGRTFKGKADFQHATFEGVPYFERGAFKEDVTFRLAHFAIRDVRSGWREWLSLLLPANSIKRRKTKRERDEALHQAERAFSNLKDAMKDAGATRTERRFHVLELRARRRRSDREVGASERITSYLYDAFSEYGESIRKPLLWAFALPIIFAAVFWLIGQSFSLRDAVHAIDFSLQQISRPFYIWSQDYTFRLVEKRVWLTTDLFHGYDATNMSAWRALLVKLVASAESISAVTVAFLLALSIRRRFQVQ